MGDVVTLVVRILFGLLMGESASILTGGAGLGAGLLGLLDDAVLIILKSSLSLGDQIALTLAAQEATKLLDAAEWSDRHSEKQRQAQARYLGRVNPHTVYAYGDVSYFDVGLLAYSAEALAERGLPLIPNQAVADIYDIQLDITEVTDAFAAFF